MAAGIIFFSDDLFDLLDVVGEHFLDSALEGGSWGRTSGAGSNHFDSQDSCLFVEGDKLDVSSIVLDVRSDSAGDNLFDKLDNLGIIRIDVIWFWIDERVQTVTLLVSKGFLF